MGFWEGVGGFFVTIGKGVDEVASNVPIVNVAYNGAKATGAMAVAGVVAATGNDASGITKFAGNQVKYTVHHPLGDAGKAIHGTDIVATNTPIVGTVWDTGKALGATTAAGVIALEGGDPHPMLDVARDAGIDAGINLVADVATVATAGAGGLVARGTATGAKIASRAVLSSTAKVLEKSALKGGAEYLSKTAAQRLAANAIATSTVAEEAGRVALVAQAEHEATQAVTIAATQQLAGTSALTQAAEREATQASIKAEQVTVEHGILSAEATDAASTARTKQYAVEAARLAENTAETGVKDAAKIAAVKQVELVAARKAEALAVKAAEKAEASQLAAAEKEAAWDKMTTGQKMWTIAKPTKIDVAFATGMGLGLNGMMNEPPLNNAEIDLDNQLLPMTDAVADVAINDPLDLRIPPAGTEDRMQPQLHPDVDLHSLLNDVGFTSPLDYDDLRQRVESARYGEELVKYTDPDISWMVVPLVLTAGLLLVSEA